MHQAPQAPGTPVSLDLAAVARRILELRDLSLQEHLEVIGRSQASALQAWVAANRHPQSKGRN